MGVDAEMFVRTFARVDEARVRELAWEVAEAFGADNFWIWKDGYSGDRRALTLITEYEQDGDTIYPAEGETFIQVSPATRYYGPGYERGDLPFLIGLADWLERRIPGAHVWYGGDSSGRCAEPFGKAERETMLAHFAEYGHCPYVGDPRTGNTDSLAVFGRPDKWARRSCDFCEQPMTRYGWGGDNYAAVSCAGCGRDESTHDGGATWRVTKDVGGRAVSEPASEPVAQ